LAATDYKLGLSVLYLFNSVDDLAVIKLIPLLIHDMEHCTKVERTSSRLRKKMGRFASKPESRKPH
jgi:hypothetical protein